MFYSLARQASATAEVTQQCSTFDSQIVYRQAIGDCSGFALKYHSDKHVIGIFVAQVLSLRQRVHSVEPSLISTVPLYQALAMFSWQDCTIPYDRIFGLLGLTSSVLLVDYSMPKLELATRVMFETFLQLDKEAKLSSTLNLVRSLHHLILLARGVYFDHPTVTCTIAKIYELAGLRTKGLDWHAVVIRRLSEMRYEKSVPATLDNYDDEALAFAQHRTRRLLHYCDRYNRDTILLPVDEIGPETLAARLKTVEDIFHDVVRRMIFANDRLPAYLESLPLDSSLRMAWTPVLQEHIKTQTPAGRQRLEISLAVPWTFSKIKHKVRTLFKSPLKSRKEDATYGTHVR